MPERDLPGGVIVDYTSPPDYGGGRHVWPTHTIVGVEDTIFPMDLLKPGALVGPGGAQRLDAYLLGHGVDPRLAYDKAFFGQPCLGVGPIPEAVLPKGYLDPAVDSGQEILDRSFAMVNDHAFGRLYSADVRWTDDIEAQAGSEPDPETKAAFCDWTAHTIWIADDVLYAEAPRSFVTYLIYHEILHLACPPSNPFDDGHGPSFTALDSLFPGWSPRTDLGGFYV